MSNVYFLPAGGNISADARKLLDAVITRENVRLADHIPLKVHFGEKGNKTYLKPGTYSDILEYLRERGIESEYMETSVLYGGARSNREKHLELAKAHGFDQIPVVIADGDNGEASVNVQVDLKHFSKCAVAAELAKQEQVLVMSHFKGHGLAGFGGAIKQLSMGFASKGGKMAMHMSVQPEIINFLCKKCRLCTTRCQVDAITVEKKKAWIDHAKCLGCGACYSICPHHAVSVFTWKGLANMLFRRNSFREKLVEYAYAAAHGKQHIYLNFAVNITGGCDCEPRPMWKCADDVGIFASLDPVAVDAACYDAVAKAGKKFKGAEQLDYAEKIGLGTRSCNLIQL